MLIELKLISEFFFPVLIIFCLVLLSKLLLVKDPKRTVTTNVLRITPIKNG